MEKLYIERTKKGYPALWESGGGASNTGTAIVISGQDGEPLKPLFIKTGGHLSNAEHALFAVREGYIVVSVHRHHEDFFIRVFKIDSFTQNHAELTIIYSELNGDSDIPEKFNAAVDAAKAKSAAYHCRKPYYYLS